MTPHIFESNLHLMDPGLTRTKQMLDAQIKQNIITIEESKIYLDAVEQAPLTGHCFWTNEMSVLSFKKKA